MGRSVFLNCKNEQRRHSLTSFLSFTVTERGIRRNLTDSPIEKLDARSTKVSFKFFSGLID